MAPFQLKRHGRCQVDNRPSPVAPSFFCQNVDEPEGRDGSKAALIRIRAVLGEGDMLAFPVIGIVAGIVLGLRFKIPIFVPIISLTGAAVVLFGLAGGHDPRAIALALFAAMVSLQIGYIVGCALQDRRVDADPTGRRTRIPAASIGS
jgi:hypothetical protein